MKLLLALPLLLISSAAGAQYLDGLPSAATVTPADIVPVCQNGTAGFPGTCTTRKASIAVLSAGIVSVVAGIPPTTTPFNAKCDGSSDDHVALNAWLAAGAAGLSLALPEATCAFAVPLSVTNASSLTINGVSPTQSILLYTGAATTSDLLTIGSLSSFSNGVYLHNFRVASSTVMTAGTGIHLIQARRSILDGVYADGQDGNGNLWNGIWFDSTDDMIYDHYQANGQNDSVRFSNADTLKLGSGRITPPQGKASAVGVHIGGGTGGFECENSDIAQNGTNVLIDNGIVAAGNRQTFFGPLCIIDTANIDDNVRVNDPISSNSSIDFYNWNSAATRYAINIVSAPSSYITLNGGQTWNAGSDCIFVQSASPRVAFSSSVMIHSCGGYGVNASVTTLNIFGAPNMFMNNGGGTGLNASSNSGLHFTIWAGNSAPQPALQIYGGLAANDDAGGQITLCNSSSGATAPCKSMRVAYGGDWQIVNNAYTFPAGIDISDAGVQMNPIFNQAALAGTPPTVSTGAGDCGTAPVMGANAHNNGGTLTVGSSTNGAQCTITFSKAFNRPAVCSVWNQTTGANAVYPQPTVSGGNGTGLVIKATSAITAGDVLGWACFGS